jgi:Replicative DNA helicase
MLGAANDLAKLAYDQEKTVETIIDEAEKSIFGLSERRVRHDIEPIATVLSHYYDRIGDLSQRDEEIFGVPTGLMDLDRLLGGLQKSDLLIVAGRPGSGKNWFSAFSCQERCAKTQKACRHFLTGNVQRTTCSALDRPGNLHRYTAFAHRQIE